MQLLMISNLMACLRLHRIVRRRSQSLVRSSKMGIKTANTRRKNDLRNCI
ncbi:hypothetical protein NC651_040096 [Populus alba x Populus x berolinensis]|nr:hypothetical protein NC651_040096 [Populus alba x Populus x berolinensis]